MFVSFEYYTTNLFYFPKYVKKKWMVKSEKNLSLWLWRI